MGACCGGMKHGHKSLPEKKPQKNDTLAEKGVEKPNEEDAQVKSANLNNSVQTPSARDCNSDDVKKTDHVIGSPIENKIEVKSTIQCANGNGSLNIDHSVEPQILPAVAASTEAAPCERPSDEASAQEEILAAQIVTEAMEAAIAASSPTCNSGNTNDAQRDEVLKISCTATTAPGITDDEALTEWMKADTRNTLVIDEPVTDEHVGDDPLSVLQHSEVPTEIQVTHELSCENTKVSAAIEDPLERSPIVEKVSDSAVFTSPELPENHKSESRLNIENENQEQDKHESSDELLPEHSIGVTGSYTAAPVLPESSIKSKVAETVEHLSNDEISVAQTISCEQENDALEVNLKNEHQAPTKHETSDEVHHAHSIALEAAAAVLPNSSVESNLAEAVDHISISESSVEQIPPTDIENNDALDIHLDQKLDNSQIPNVSTNISDDAVIFEQTPDETISNIIPDQSLTIVNNDAEQTESNLASSTSEPSNQALETIITSGETEMPYEESANAEVGTPTNIIVVEGEDKSSSAAIIPDVAVEQEQCTDVRESEAEVPILQDVAQLAREQRQQWWNDDETKEELLCLPDTHATASAVGEPACAISLPSNEPDYAQSSDTNDQDLVASFITSETENKEFPTINASDHAESSTTIEQDHAPSSVNDSENVPSTPPSTTNETSCVDSSANDVKESSNFEVISGDICPSPLPCDNSAVELGQNVQAEPIQVNEFSESDVPDSVSESKPAVVFDSSSIVPEFTTVGDAENDILTTDNSAAFSDQNDSSYPGSPDAEMSSAQANNAPPHSVEATVTAKA